jgi:hypothetical protein
MAGAAGLHDQSDCHEQYGGRGDGCGSAIHADIVRHGRRSLNGDGRRAGFTMPAAHGDVRRPSSRRRLSSSRRVGPLSPRARPWENPAAMPEPPDTTPRQRLRRDLRAGLRAGLVTFWELARVMVPAYGITLVLQYVGAIDWLARAARPLMSLLGLPGDAALPLVVGYVLNIYAAVGSMKALHLAPQQIVVLALAILIGHNLIVEGAVLQRSGMNAFAFGALRVVAGLAAAALAHLLMGLF